MKTRCSGSYTPCGPRGCCPIARVGSTRNVREGNARCARKLEKGHLPP